MSNPLLDAAALPAFAALAPEHVLPAVQARLMELYMKLELKRLAMQDGEDVGELCDEDLLLQAKLLAKEISGEAA